MKKSDIQNQVLIMCGISGSGKTHYALQCEENGYIRLSIDAIIWGKVGAGLFSLSKEEQKRLFTECRMEVRSLFIELLKSGRKVVVDATHCSRSSRDDIRNICAKLEVKPVFVYCYAEKEELWRRLSKRKGTGPDDLIVSREELSGYWRSFERPQEDESDFVFFNKSGQNPPYSYGSNL